MKIISFAAVSLGVLSGWSLQARAATVPAGFKDTRILSGINPTTMDIAPDGRIFYCEKNGRVRIVKDDKLLPRPFLSLDVDIFQERGLLAVTFDPGFPGNPYVYVYYTAKNPSHNRVSRFKADGDTATGGEQVLIDFNNLSSIGYHNGGGIRFGKDGKLYIAVGNNANDGYSQSLTVLLGKILRINPDGGIPTDNPFYAQTAGSNRAIWALGFRNPFTTAIQPGTGRFLIDEVGESTSEEIDEGKAGSNYGWPKAEGHANTAPAGLTGAYADPVYTYDHGEGCAITGGSFYQPIGNSFGSGYPGLYFFGDYCGGWIRTLDFSSGKADKAAKAFATGILRPVDVKVGPDGSLYYLARGNRASGVGQGSEQDNTSTQDGSLNKVTGPVTVSLRPQERAQERDPDRSRTMIVIQGNLIQGNPNRAILPGGKSALSVFDSKGKRICTVHRGGRIGDLPVTLPAKAAFGIVHVTLD